MNEEYSETNGSNEDEDEDEDDDTDEDEDDDTDDDKDDDEGHTFVKKDFVLENKQVMDEAELYYQTYGTLNEARDNALVVCHTFTGNANLHSWWGGLLGDDEPFDTSKYFVICCNVLGSCYGSTPYRDDDSLPDISVQDTVRLQLLLLKEELKLSSVKSVIGGSFGGMQALEFAVQGGSVFGEFRATDGRFPL
jgi:homoserine O-acetyltransferase/O-succinyltransferase